ncbi:MAG: VWA domain-containing protein [Mariniblastus sp.]|nr:VWA domain-containing protein [Mariniblastus sp.]
MSKFWTKVATKSVCVALIAIGVQAISATSYGDEEPRLATYDSAGETHFALSIPMETAESRASDIVVYIDTSASQTGAFKRDSIEAVKQLLRNLNAEDRVQLFAVDLDPVPLTQGFVSPGSNGIQVALQNLTDRVPLGSTDVESMLDSATKSFANTKARNKNAIYIGDGISRGSLLQTEVFSQLVTKLADSNISVSSFAIGPDRNIELMAALANNTGGNLYVDTDSEDSVKNCAAGLASTVHASVFWPTSGKLDESVVDMFPRRFIPLRSDRDSIILGTLADRESVDIQVTGMVDGKQHEFNWTIAPEASDQNFAFLPGMVNDARADNGLSLPTLGSVGLKEFARSRNFQANRLSDLSDQALATGNIENAKQLANRALKVSASPVSTKADLLAMASTYKVQEDDPFDLGGDTKPAKEAPASDPFASPDSKPAATKPAAPVAETPAKATQVPASPAIETPQEPTGSAVELPLEAATPDGGITLIAPSDDDEIQKLLRDESGASAGAIQTAEGKIEVINQRIKQQVIVEQKIAREEARTNPSLSLERIKNMMQIVDQSPDLYPSTRAELRHTLESTLLSFRQQKLSFDDRQALLDINISQSLALAAMAQRQEREEEKIIRLTDQFNTMLNEGNYRQAVDVADNLAADNEFNTTAIVAQEKAHLARNYELMTELRRQKVLNFQEAMYEIEKTTIPFPGNPLMIFPDKEEWDRKKLRRAKYKNLRLTGSEREEAILDALDKESNLNYDETPWTEIEEELERKYGINIVLTSSAKDDILTEDEPVTVNLTGIRLKNALRIMLETKNATFVVQDEVLKIISLDDAEDIQWFVTNVYNVGDLVAPRQPVQGGGGGGFGGGQGGGFGGQGGGGFGGGQGGGGFGGGQGGAGGAGLFCVQESKISLNFSDKGVSKKPQVINLSEGQPIVAWSTYFENNFADPAEVRLTARKLMNANNPGEVASMIYGAIKHDQLQPWMYEGLVIALQVSGKPQIEIERALMSAVDLSTDENDLLYAATFMASNGMEKRAIRLLEGFARQFPTRTEPYVIGLRAAQQTKDIDAIKWATVGVFSQEWPDHPEIVKQAKFAAEGVKNSLKKSGRTDELAAFEADLQNATERDCYIKVSWTGDADLDLYIEEPGGTVCSRLVRRTTAGGVVLGDNFTAKPGVSGVVSEEYILPKGFAGDYRLIVKRVWGQVTSGKVNVSIHNHYNSDHEASLTKQVNIDNEGVIVLFSLDKGRRTEPLEDHAIQTVVKRQMTANRHVLAQNLAGSYSSGAASDYYGGLVPGGNNPGNGFGGGIGNGGLRPGAVGYTPVITQLFEGTQLSINHATTADRLYVMVSASPQFTQVTEVATFNILGDADTAQGIAGSGGGGGGGQNGGGGGGFGGGGGGGGGVF